VSLDDARIVDALRELAALGSRIGEQAGELARIVRNNPASTSPPGIDVAADVLESATKLTTAIDRVAGGSHPRIDRRQTAGRRRAPHVRSVTRCPRVLGNAPVRGAAVATAVRQGSTALRRDSRAARHRILVGPVLASIIVHAVVIVGLALVFVAGNSPVDRRVITLAVAAEAPLEDEAVLVAIPATEQPFEEVADAGGRPGDPHLPAIEPISIPMPEVSTDSAFEPGLIDSFGLADMAVRGDGVVAAADGLGGKGDGDGGPQRPGAARQGGPAATFFGRTGQGGNVCFVCDNSNSYRDGGFHTVLDEVARAVESLRADQSFFVIFFSDAAYPLLHPRGLGSLQKATSENKRKLRAWLETVEMCRGGQGIHDALKLAGALGADAIYLLSDGQLAASVVDQVKAADCGGAVVHTFGVQQAVGHRCAAQPAVDRLREQQGWNRNMIDIATAHRGTFTPVIIPPEAAVFEGLRPIPRNRTRGGAWGLKL